MVIMDRRKLTRWGTALTAILALGVLSGCTGSTTAAPSPVAVQTSAAPAAASSPATGTAPSGPITVAPLAQAPTSSEPTHSSAAPSPAGPGSTTAGSTPAASTGPAGSPTAKSSPTPTPKPAPKPKRVPPVVTASPALGADGLAPRGPITVTAAHGTLSALTVTNSAGKPVQGSLSADKTTWTLGEPLGYDASYQVTGTAVGAGGATTPIAGTYSTVNPDGVIDASISPTDGKTVGIAAPIMISLGTDITDTEGRANIEKAITVTTVPKTEGAFAWIHHDNGWGLDWRPKAYWQPGTKVTVTANLYGVSYGDNLWGEQDLSSSFTIGRAQVVKGDINTHRLKVYRDGKLLFDFPTSYGLESDPGRVTHSGTYIVMSKEYLHLMSNPKYHYKNFKAYYAVRVSNNGTFIHANDGTADIQGHKNETHGCANLTMTNAKAYYDTVLYGDPVEITGSNIPLSSSDGDIYDWAIPWSEWLTMSARSGSSTN